MDYVIEGKFSEENHRKYEKDVKEMNAKRQTPEEVQRIVDYLKSSLVNSQ